MLPLVWNMTKCIILPYKGCGNLENVVLLFNFIRQYAPHINMIVHRDRDYLDDQVLENYSKRLQEYGIFFGTRQVQILSQYL